MDKIIYELPLNEQIRVLIRLEYLLRAFYTYSKNIDQHSLYLALKSLDDILSIMERNNIKKYVLFELNELAVKLEDWRNRAGVDAAMIDKIVAGLKVHKAKVTEGSQQINSLSNSDFLKHFRQRVNVAGGMSLVDFPRYHFWVQQDLSEVQSVLLTWGLKFEACYRAVQKILQLIRKSADKESHVARSGYFQESLEKGVSYKLIRVTLAANAPCFAEVSGGRYHITVRMMQDHWEQGPSVCEQDIPFELEKCKL